GLRERLDPRAVHARTGCMLHWSYWPAKLNWIRRTGPDVFQAARRWVSFGEFLVERLTGATGVSVSMASGTGLLDVPTCPWDSHVLEACGVEAAHLGKVVPLSAPATGTQQTVGRWPELRGVPWLPAVGDGACSNLGAGCATPRHFAVMIGTSGAERVVDRAAA